MVTLACSWAVDFPQDWSFPSSISKFFESVPTVGPRCMDSNKVMSGSIAVADTCDAAIPSHWRWIFRTALKRSVCAMLLRISGRARISFL